MKTNILKIEDFEQKKSGMTFCTQLQPIERLIWLYIQNYIRKNNPDKWEKGSYKLLQNKQLEDDFAYIISSMVKEGWISGEEAIKYGYSLIQKTDIYLNA